MNNFMKAVIFDFDGVIHDTFELAYKACNETSAKKVTPEQYKDFFNGNIFVTSPIDSEAAKKEDEDFHVLLAKYYGILKIEEEVKNALEKLSKKYLLFIISSNREKILNAYFKNNNFTDVFKNIMGAETHKSKVVKFNMILKNNNLKNDECIFVTDTLGDILEANKFGLKTIAVDFGFHERERLEKGNPFKIASSFKDILQIIESLSN